MAATLRLRAYVPRKQSEKARTAVSGIGWTRFRRMLLRIAALLALAVALARPCAAVIAPPAWARAAATSHRDGGDGQREDGPQDTTPIFPPPRSPPPDGIGLPQRADNEEGGGDPLLGDRRGIPDRIL